MEKKGVAYALDAEEIGELQQEGIQYYHRYISLFQLSDYLGVIRDTQRNLEMFHFVSGHAQPEELAQSVEQFTPYVLMMQTRAKASIEIEREEYATAVKKIEDGMDKFVRFTINRKTPRPRRTARNSASWANGSLRRCALEATADQTGENAVAADGQGHRQRGTTSAPRNC